MAFEAVSEERLAEARNLLDNGATYAQVKESTGLSYPTIRKYFGKKDPKPGGRRSQPRSTTPKKKAGQPTDEQLTSTFTKVAVAPAVPMMLLFHCEFCATHFKDSGPEAAAKLVELSQDNPALRSVLETVWKWGEEVAWATLLASYVGIPLAHHLAPNFLYGVLQMFTNLPPRGPAAQPHTHAHAGTNGATGFESLDDETLMRMAQSMGIKVEPNPPGPADVTLSPDDVTEYADTPEEGTTPSDSSDAATVSPDAFETVAADSDTSE